MVATRENNVASGMFDASNHCVSNARSYHFAGRSKVGGGKSFDCVPGIREMLEGLVGVLELIMRRDCLFNSRMIEFRKDDF